jgi:multiple sugar transport system ATP-binding protein
VKTKMVTANQSDAQCDSAKLGIELKSLSMVFADGTVALDSLNLAIRDGDFVVLVGPSGCGKSTALRLLAGLERPTSGEVRIGGRDVTYEDPQDRDIAMVFQSYALYPHKTVYENLAYPLRVRRMAKDEIGRRVKSVSNILGLTPLLARRPRALSGGQRQRVAMGRALVREPIAFLMDEPLSNLDAALRVEMRGEIRRLHNRLGVTTVYVTHDQVEAMTMGDRVAVLRGGVLQQFDAPQTLYENPRNVFVASFIGSPAINLARGSLDEIDGRLIFAGLSISLPESRWLRRPDAVRARKVIVGIRPEMFNYRRDPEHDVSLAILPDLVESLGSELLVHFPVAAPPAPIVLTSALPRGPSEEIDEAKSDARFMAKLDARCGYSAGASQNIWFSTAHLMMFDAASGETLMSSEQLVRPRPGISANAPQSAGVAI